MGKRKRGSGGMVPPAADALAWVTAELGRVSRDSGGWDLDTTAREYEAFREASADRGCTFSASGPVCRVLEARIEALRNAGAREQVRR